MKERTGRTCPWCNSPDVWRWHRESGVMKIYAAAFNRMMLTCRACGTRFFVKSPQTAPEDLEPVAAPETDTAEAEVPETEEAVAVNGAPENHARRGLKVRLKIRTRRRSEFRAVS